MEILIATAIGLCFGSFISMLSYRLPRDEDICLKPSNCPKCKHKLGAKDLIPLFSWLLSGGKCRYCKVEIHIRYPAIEISTAFSFAFLVTLMGVTALSISLMALAVILIALSVTDFEHYIIPDTLQIALLVVALIWAYLVNYSIDFILGSALAGFCSSYGLALAFKYFRHKEGLGFGDVKFIAIAAIFIGYQNLVIFYFFSGLFGTANGLIWQKFLKKKLFPFAPSLAISLFFCLIIPFIFGNSWVENFNLLENVFLRKLLG